MDNCPSKPRNMQYESNMKNLQEEWSKLEAIKADLKRAQKEMKTYYEQEEVWPELQEQQKQISTQKKAVKQSVHNRYPDLAVYIEDKKIDLASQREMVNDIAFSQMLKGETVEVQDQYEQIQIPLFTVKFQKDS